MKTPDQPSHRILTLLEQDARLTAAQIAEQTGLPERKVHAIISRLEQEGLIRHYKAVINWEKAGTEKVYALIEVKVTPQRGVGFDAIAERIVRFPEVHSLYLISGAYDLHVVVEGSSMKEVAYFVAEKLAPMEQVQGTATHFVLKRYKIDGDLLEEREQSQRLPVTA